MNYELDSEKARVNWVRHSVAFESAVNFDWATALETIDDQFDFGEERWVAIGFILHRVCTAHHGLCA